MTLKVDGSTIVVMAQATAPRHTPKLICWIGGARISLLRCAKCGVRQSNYFPTNDGPGRRGVVVNAAGDELDWATPCSPARKAGA